MAIVKSGLMEYYEKLQPIIHIVGAKGDHTSRQILNGTPFVPLMEVGSRFFFLLGKDYE